MLKEGMTALIKVQLTTHNLKIRSRINQKLTINQIRRVQMMTHQNQMRRSLLMTRKWILSQMMATKALMILPWTKTQIVRRIRKEEMMILSKLMTRIKI